MTTYRRFVALGDSVTEGSGDVPHPDGTPQGWADRFAATLAAHAPDLQYANVAVRGKLTRQVRAEQLEPARRLRPDLAAVITGMNDLLRPRFDLAAVGADVDAMVTSLQGGGATVLMMTFPDLSAVSPVGRLMRPRVLALNTVLRTIASRRGASILDVHHAASSGDPRLWSEDRLHLNAAGHALLAAAMATVVGLPGDETWRDPLAPAPATTVRARMAAEASWVRLYVGPWVGNRVRRRSSGDGRTAKRPDLAPVVVP